MAEERRHIDPVTGIATTGHEWDGLRELNTPLPRWWLWLFYLTVVWAIGYWIVYPAWPLLTTSTQGVFGYHTRSAVCRGSRSAQAATRADGGKAGGRVAIEHRCRSAVARLCPSAGGGWPSPTIALPVMVPVARVSRAIQTSTTTIGFGAASSLISSTQFVMVHAPATTRDGPVSCRLSAKTIF